MARSSATLIVIALLLSGCPTDPQPEPIGPTVASFSCADDGAGGAPEWSFGVSISGPVDEARTTAFAQSDDVQDTDGFAMTVQGGNETTTAFATTVPGTEAGQDPAPGDVPFACSDSDLVLVIYCATPEGRPNERPCWACDDGSGGPPPEGTEDWIACD